MKRSDDCSTHSAPVKIFGDHLTVLTADTTTVTPFYVMESTLSNTSMDGVDVLSPEPSPKNAFQYWHQRIGPFVTNPNYRRTVLGLILLNTLVLGLRTFDVVRQQQVLLQICNVMVRICQVIFSAELVVELAYHQVKILHRGWIFLDIMIVITSWWTHNTTVLVFRGFRLLRAFRKATRVPALRETVRALLKALRMLSGLAVLLTMLIFMFAVWFTDMNVVAGENNDLDDDAYFSSLGVSALTLYQIMTGGRLWASIAMDLQQQQNPGALLVLVAFVSVSIFCFGGMAVAILVQALVSATQDGLAPSCMMNKRMSETATTAFSAPPVGMPHGMLRLEQKVDCLSRTVEQLMGMQVALQESIHELTLQQQRARTESGFESKSRPPSEVSTD